MDFGRAENIENIDFTLPDDHEATDKLFASLKKKKRKKGANVYVGCSKWGIKEWLGILYPADTSEKKFRDYYIKQFNSIELNASHYKTPSAAQIKVWKEGVDKNFKFCPKFPRSISHIKRLKDCEKQTEWFYKSMKNFGPNLGASFLQLPPNFAPKNFEVLEKYVSSLPNDFNVCIEFRHPGWFSDAKVFDETFEMLRENKIGTVITDTAGRRDVVHTRLTTPTVFLRFVGNNLHPTDFERVNDWVFKMKKWIYSGIENVYFLMHMHDEKDSPELSSYTINQLNKKCKLKLKLPHFYNKDR